MRKIEILAPAGSYETLVAAINGGADAVYVGGAMFGARAYANNFAEEELIKAIRYVHLHGKQLFLTVNTLLKNKEVEDQLLAYLKGPYEAGLDAVIVQDVGVMQFIHKHFKGLQIHASTQMTLTMAKGSDLFRECGVTRLVTSRELTLPEIKAIRATTDLEIESFVHGALCYSFSGQCLMSSMLGGRSGNRGRCAQTCRMPYELKDEGKVISDPSNPYLLSPKDMCTLDLIPELVESGIDSFKIEGRMKRPEYAAYVAHLYRKYVDLYQSLGEKDYRAYIKKNKELYDQDVKNLMDLYNRGNFSTGYYTCHNSKSMMSTDRPNHAGVLVGEVVGIKGNQAKIKLQEEVFPQDLLEIRGVEDVYEYTLKDGAPKGSSLTSNFKFGLRLKQGDKVYRTKNQTLLDTIADQFIKVNKKVPMNGYFTASLDAPMSLLLTAGEVTVQVFGEIPTAAEKQAASEEKVKKQLGKTNATPFEFEQLEVVLNGELFIPVGWLNDLRRQAIEALEEAIQAPYERVYDETKQTMESAKEKQEESTVVEEKKVPGMVTVVSNIEQLNAVVAMEEVTAVYYRMDNINLLQGFELAKEYVNKKKPCFLVMPHVFRKSAYEEFEKCFGQLDESMRSYVTGFVVKSYEELEFLDSHGLGDYEIVLDYNMYTMNNQAKEFYRNRGLTHFTTPVELNFSEVRELGCSDSDYIVYGHIPLMTSANCVVKTTVGCNKKTKKYELKDRYNKNFVVMNYCKYCYNVIYNADPLSLLGNQKEVLSLRPKNIRLDFTVEDKKEVKEIVKAYAESFLFGGKGSLKITNFTKGHFKRGIE